MRGFHVVLGLLVLSCSSRTLVGRRGPDASAGCAKDTDCKGDRICSRGECVSPTEADASGGIVASGGSTGSKPSGGATGVDASDAAAPPGSGGQFASGSGGDQSTGGVFSLGTGGRGGAGGSGGAQSACSGPTFDAPASPVDMYVMFDQSSSMGDPLPMSSPPTTWWGAAQQAVTNFVNDPRAAGSQGRQAMSVGIQFFPLGGMEPQSCMANYKTPEVEVGVLPGNAAAIAAAIAKHQPSAFTPTAPALSGAIAHMKEWAPKHPGHVPVVVLVTDGFPTECDPKDITDIAQIAKTAFETVPSVRTFVVGFNFGAGGANLKELAVAGGTANAFLINGGDIGSQFVDAMLSISSTPLACDFKLPTASGGQPLDVSKIAVTYTPNATMVETWIPKLNGLGDCELNMNTGWFFDSPTSPTKIQVCPGTCAKFSAGVVKILTGCPPLTDNR